MYARPSSDHEEVGPSKKRKVSHHKESPTLRYSDVHGSNRDDGDESASESFAAAMQDRSETGAHKRPRKASSASRRIEISNPELALRHKLTSEEGQLEEHPDYTPDQAREAAKREYNRRNAARARIRLKCTLTEMHEKCASMNDEIQSLKDENAALKAELNEMKQQARRQSLSADRLRLSDITLPTDRGLYLPQLRGALETDRLLQGSVLAPQWQSNEARLQQLITMGGVTPLVPSVQPELALGQPLMNSLILARARAALHPNSSLTLSELGNSSLFLPK
ncbi:hypothetical protein FisN_8Hh399 [Fistulifera solaris]|jgi:hypothetical protein|uniref:BZIP domain-containing protein n=1 Tax=Fistulifera solaris TaxID=1519565 RepID=A0A1Z5JMU7_FISSO|nr:hypothetical protein FisN_8Hh399 [Fistulifera solaris]|eukprot:GAX15304.1 hypothetical protein FisN_8Hh399 [Fistulifera solaris]